MYSSFIKPALDLLGAILLLLILSPVIIIVALLLFIQNKGTPLFKQERNGKDEKVFRVIKFKTMTDETDDEGNLLPNSERLTPLGKVIRKTSIDELPQLLNILKGDMSFIGPRPLPVRYRPFFTDRERKRFLIRPGISGLAQVSGRNLVHWDKRLAMDVEYVENLSFGLDLKIFFRTIKNIFFRENLVVDPTTRMIDFDVLRKQQNGTFKKEISEQF
jgi:lipopolysaccharide/colanic/teichoic acid biosynthesis glycosyltransferase